MARTYLDFERSLAEIDAKIDDLLASEGEAAKGLAELRAKADAELSKLYTKLGPWEKTRIARHEARPHYTDYVRDLVTDYTPLSGDRKFGDDNALLGGLGKIRGRSVVVMGHEKGTDTESRLKHNFGMANPEGYRKAVRLMDLAERFSIPVVSFVDTAGAYPGRGAEERGQAEAIARSIDRGLSLKVPFISVITGEGGSGGAVAIATADRVMMLEHSIYSVISPEGCASILWRDGTKAQDAAKAMKITAQDLKRLKIIDTIIKEPIGGAHRTPERAIKKVGTAIVKALDELSEKSAVDLIKDRRGKFLNIGRSLQ
ncbi:acetyl-CoA carboxylase carboxyl transferase subunit alpha [Litorimonas taeanensis]|uniref:Acetyl-coenzyme A carboxylase carboxyl transferase subunit alpha n=1 Tax=Litorimonas taeanensis TaxID=568099 RepID=A0A420WF02_9PROT|nr:acetyl-CoA carboxylase carboxyltransferase subunit alpha [Litorimonas taeanensis]RKQ69568.1 acetyl-CoA carboxylase carboxyl transferase subunit alpha [Litorimonas taeanensis]